MCLCVLQCILRNLHSRQRSRAARWTLHAVEQLRTHSAWSWAACSVCVSENKDQPIKKSINQPINLIAPVCVTKKGGACKPWCGRWTWPCPSHSARLRCPLGAWRRSAGLHSLLGAGGEWEPHIWSCITQKVAHKNQNNPKETESPTDVHQPK